MIKYNKKVLANKTINYNNDYYEILVLDDNEWYNIHILNEKYKDEEVNTLYLQEPKDCISLEEVTSPIYMECQGLQFALWDKYNKSFSIEYESEV